MQFHSWRYTLGIEVKPKPGFLNHEIILEGAATTNQPLSVHIYDTSTSRM